ncbi:mRNA interferase YafQ [Nitrosospira multiformis]|uniref:mRNA interferase YafQ n=1 Tax=Nitrosospira multiformis TaxID=1231 RepID=A0A1I7GR77_9PROT|nr:mRNA interferase YafQ [Nitrosospira multiformis]
MRRIRLSHTFRRDFKLVKADYSSHRDINSLLEAVMNLLVRDVLLPARCVDHGMKGK